VTIPKEIRDRFGIGPETEVEFSIVEGAILLKRLTESSISVNGRADALGRLRRSGILP
jgi:AbrB family looped-hinge helix DNA binding protein